MCVVSGCHLSCRLRGGGLFGAGLLQRGPEETQSLLSVAIREIPAFQGGPLNRARLHRSGTRRYRPCSHTKRVPRAQVYQLASKKETIVAAFIPGAGSNNPGSSGGGSSNPGSSRGVRWTLVHSHGNAVDLGEAWVVASGCIHALLLPLLLHAA